jgi:hypothetical protein
LYCNAFATVPPLTRDGLIQPAAQTNSTTIVATIAAM